MHQESKKAVVAALFGNLCIAIFKLIAALISGSSSMLAEGYHSVSDTFNQVLLLYGLKKSKKPPGSPFFGVDPKFLFFPIKLYFKKFTIPLLLIL